MGECRALRGGARARDSRAPPPQALRPRLSTARRDSWGASPLSGSTRGPPRRRGLLVPVETPERSAEANPGCPAMLNAAAGAAGGQSTRLHHEAVLCRKALGKLLLAPGRPGSFTSVDHVKVQPRDLRIGETLGDEMAQMRPQPASILGISCLGRHAKVCPSACPPAWLPGKAGRISSSAKALIFEDALCCAAGLSGRGRPVEKGSGKNIWQMWTSRRLFLPSCLPGRMPGCLAAWLPFYTADGLARC